MGRGDFLKQWLDKIFFLQREPDMVWPMGKKIGYFLWRFLVLLAAGISLGALALIFAYGNYSWGVFLGYFDNLFLVTMNVLPAVLLAAVVYVVLALAIGAVTRQDLQTLPKGEKLADRLHLR